MAEEFERECVLFFEDIVQIFGVPKSVGQIYGLLYASPIPLSFSDIVERLEISKGSASQGIQLLRSLGAINEAGTSVAGGRLPEAELQTSNIITARNARVAYEPELSLRRLVSGVLQERIAPMAVASTQRLSRLRELAEQDGGKDDFYLGRAKQLEKWRRRLKAILPVLGTLLGPKSRK